VLITAPDIRRFGGAATWILCASATALSLANVSRIDPSFRVRCRIAIASALILCAASVGQVVGYVNSPHSFDGLSPLPIVSYDTRTTKSGFQINVSQDSRNAIWDVPLPAVSKYPTDFSLRRPSDLSEGFVALPRTDATTADFARQIDQPNSNVRR